MAKPDVGLAYGYAVLMFVFPVLGAVALVHSNSAAVHVQIRLRAELTALVYRKALCLSSRRAGFRAPFPVRRVRVRVLLHVEVVALARRVCGDLASHIGTAVSCQWPGAVPVRG